MREARPHFFGAMTDNNDDFGDSGLSQILDANLNNRSISEGKKRFEMTVHAARAPGGEQQGYDR